MSRIVGITLRSFSILFKFMGIGCLILTFVMVRTLVESKTVYNYSAYPELYVLAVVVSFLVPVSGAIVAFIASFLLDIWVLIRIQTKMIREINSYGRTETKHFL